jgi:exodeoxyribonuclease V alpha subunit
MSEEKFKFKMSPIAEIYYNDDNLYGIYKFSTNTELPNSKQQENLFDSDNSYVSTLTGKMQKLTIGLDYSCEGKQVFNKKYKQWQYEVVKIIPEAPNSLEAQEKFLKCIITETQANTLLSVYPNIVEMIMNNEPIDLSKTKGIKEYTFDKIQNKVMENYVLADILTMLRPLGVTITMIKKLLQDQPNPILLKRELKENPYILTRIKGLGFDKVDKLALSMNKDLKISKFRTKAYIEFFLTEEGENNGHTRFDIKVLNEAIKNKINECYSMYLEILESESDKEKFLHINQNQIGLLKYFRREQEILNILNMLNTSDCEFIPTEEQINRAFEEFIKTKGYSPTNEQKEAVLSLRNNNVAIIAGSAGSGKSTIIDIVIKIFVEQFISQTALSAKASQRMTEVTGKDASTIHRLLGFNGGGFEHDENNTLPSNIVILDEASMVNSSIFLALLKAIRKGSKVLIVFDYAQLPPIGAGNIATDLLQSDFSVNVLTKVHRQAEESGILSDANIIRTGKNPIEKPEYNMVRGNLKDMHYMFRMDKQEIFDLTIKYFMKSIETLSLDEVCICVPRKKDVLNSALKYNLKIQDLLLGNEPCYVDRGDKKYKLGAKVIQKVNNYEKQVVNGEVGYISDIDIMEKIFKVKYMDDKVIEYDFKELDQLELAYALTVHSTQGSQYHTVIIPLDMSSYMLLSKELIYTAITRASKRCLVIAEPKAFSIGIKRKAGKRNTWLQLLQSAS